MTGKVTGLDRLRASMLKGWTIPRAMEWLFWPMGYTPPAPPITFAGRPGDVVVFEGVVVGVTPAPQNIVPLAGKFFEVVLPGRKGFWEQINAKHARSP